MKNKNERQKQNTSETICSKDGRRIFQKNLTPPKFFFTGFEHESLGLKWEYAMRQAKNLFGNKHRLKLLS